MKHKMLTLFLVVLLPCLSVCVHGSCPGDIEKTTYEYSQKDGISLKLDKYRLKGTETDEQSCLVFLFGGSFRGGSRDGGSYLAYYDYFARQGYTVVAIDYRLGLKNVHNPDLEKVVPALANAVFMAVEDLYDATNYILKNASDWNVDPEKIIISGSSAGAIAVLQAEYEHNRQSPFAGKLPSGFQYAGVIGFAGAIFSQGQMAWNGKAAPMLLFHGDMDSTVPFSRLEISGIQFCGSEAIAQQLIRSGSPHCLYRMIGCKHEISTDPMKNNLEEIGRFLSLFIEEKQPLIIDTNIRTIGREKNDIPLTLEDFIRNNFKTE